MLDPDEECDPPAVEACRNRIDDDDNGLVDCGDPRCASAEIPTCGANCQEVQPCKQILRDPAMIRFGDGGLDYFKIHGRVVADEPDYMNPLEEGFTILVTNARGVVYEGTVPADDFIDRPGRRVLFKDKAARSGGGSRDGLYRVSARMRKDCGELFYFFSVKAYADLSRAVEPVMTTQIYGVHDVGAITAEWTARKWGWVLRMPGGCHSR